MLFNRNTKHLRCRTAINVLAIGEYLHSPFLTCKPGKNSRFDCREVCYDKFPAILGNECCTDQLRQCIRDIVIQKFQGIVVPTSHKFPSIGKVRHMILWKILQLDDASGKSSGSVCTVILEHSSRPAILANRCLHSGVFFHTALCKLLTEGKNIRQMLRCSLECFCHSLLAESIHFQSLIRKPPFHLRYGVGIFNVGQILNLLCEVFTADAVNGNSLLYKCHIQTDAAVIDFLIQMIFIPYEIRNWETGQLLLDAHLGFHITEIVCLELFPLFHIVQRKISSSAAIGLGRGAGNTEVFDEILSLGQFLLLQSQNCTHPF